MKREDRRFVLLHWICAFPWNDDLDYCKLLRRDQRSEYLVVSHRQNVGDTLKTQTLVSADESDL